MKTSTLGLCRDVTPGKFLNTHLIHAGPEVPPVRLPDATRIHHAKASSYHMNASFVRTVWGSVCSTTVAAAAFHLLRGCLPVFQADGWRHTGLEGRGEFGEFVTKAV